jgi:LPS-assembly lipoprotein
MSSAERGWARGTGLTDGTRRGARRARGLIACLCVGSAALLGACADGSGFKPMYGSSAVGGLAVNEKLAALEVAPIPGRVGQRIRNELIFQATGVGTPPPAKYRLEVAIRESVTSTLVDIQGNAGGQVYNLDASFRLISLADKSVVAEGKSYGRAGFERLTSIFANVQAREDAENRAAQTVGEELRTRLMAYLSTRA